MDFHQLQYFVTSAQTLNFTTAANQHFITQPTMCRQISILEDELHVRLFDRSTRGIQLTAAGKHFLEYAVDALRRVDQVRSQVQNIAEGQVGIVRLSALPSSTQILTNCIAAFSIQYPDIQVSIDLPTGIGQMQALNNGSSDFYFAFTSMVENRDELEYIITQQDRYCLVVHRRDADGVNPEDFSSLAGKPFVMISQAMGPLIFKQAMDICHHRNCTPNIVNFYNHAASSLISVDAGVGMTIVPQTLIDSTISHNLVAIPIPGDDAAISYAVAWNRIPRSRASLKFLNVIQSLFPQGSQRL